MEYKLYDKPSKAEHIDCFDLKGLDLASTKTQKSIKKFIGKDYYSMSWVFGDKKENSFVCILLRHKQKDNRSYLNALYLDIDSKGNSTDMILKDRYCTYSDTRKSVLKQYDKVKKGK